MNKPAADPTLIATLDELAALGMRAARVVVRIMEIEQAAAEVLAGWLPVPGVEPGSLTEAQVAGLSVDGVDAGLKAAVPRVEGMARAFDRLSRSVRRTLALRKRVEAGWPRAGSDNRAAMMKRQVGRGVSEAIRRQAEGEAAERLFDELAERLLDPGIEQELEGLPVEEVIRRVCEDLGLAGEALQSLRARGMPAAGRLDDSG